MTICKNEGRRKKEEGRRKKEEGKLNLIGMLMSLRWRSLRVALDFVNQSFLLIV
ncbi:hypothetical protein [Phormidium nigroviride]